MLVLIVLAIPALASDWTAEGLSGKPKRITLSTSDGQKIEDTWYGTDGNRIEMSTWDIGKPTPVSGRTLYAADATGKRVFSTTYGVRPRAGVTPEVLEVYTREYRWLMYSTTTGELTSEAVYDEAGKMSQLLSYNPLVMSKSPYQKVLVITARDASLKVISIRMQVYTSASTMLMDVGIATIDAPLVVYQDNFAYSVNDAQGNWTVRTARDGTVCKRVLEYFP
jgi:hypothetical protein